MINNKSKKNDLYKLVSLKTGLSNNFIKEIIHSIFQIIIEGVVKDKIVKISGFGNFKLFRTKKRLGRNPKNMKNYIINERNVIKFLASKDFKDYLNKESN